MQDGSALASALGSAFEQLRDRLLDRLLTLRSSFDPGLARGSDAEARVILDAMVAHLGVVVVGSDLESHRAYVRSHLAQRAGQAGGLAAAVSTLVGVGDIAARVASEVHGDAGLPLAVAIARRTAITARVCSDLLAEEVERRRGELARVRGLLTDPGLPARRPT